MADLSPQAQERAQRTIVVSGVFAENADLIAAEVAAVPEGYVLVAVVDTGHEFTGTHHVSSDEVVERVPALEDGGWAMVFVPGSDADHVRKRTGELADIARQRIAMIERINARRAGD